MSWKWVIAPTLLGAAVFSVVLALAGFIVGAGVPDENAGAAAVLAAGVGAAVGGVGGGLLVFVPLLVIKLLAGRKGPPAAAGSTAAPG